MTIPPDSPSPPPLARRRRRIALALFLATTGFLVTTAYGVWWPTSQLLGPVMVSLPNSSAAPRIALTFDDGPDPGATPLVLDALRDAGAHATFFFCGERASLAPELVARAVAEGHSIGNHSWRHDALVLLSSDAIEADLARTNEALRAAIGSPDYPIKWFRPPYGVRDPRVLARAEALGMTTVTWNESPRDWQDTTPGEIVARVVESARDGAVVLLHDGDAKANRGRWQTVLALPTLLAALRQRRFRCVSLDEVARAVDR